MILHGDAITMLKTLPDESVHCCVTDPPYELGFMGKAWDSTGVAYNVDLWREVCRVLKPGGYLLAFGGSRTHHRIWCAIEDAGFEIRDTIMWVYGSGFPKSLDVSKAIDKAAGAEREVVKTVKKTHIGGEHGHEGWSRPSHFGEDGITPKRSMDITTSATVAAKEWEGWGTALKPAHEPIVVARKPLIGTVVQNVLRHGTGAINVDGCRVETNGGELHEGSGGLLSHVRDRKVYPRGRAGQPSSDCRYKEAGSVDFAATPGPRGGDERGRWPANFIHDGSEEVVDLFPVTESGQPFTGIGDRGSASRFFYTAKASPAERGKGNNHPTVKPIALIEYLVKLVSREGGIVLDPFLGSGTTGLVCSRLNRDYIGIELNGEYVKMAKRRIEGDAPLLNVGVPI